MSTPHYPISAQVPPELLSQIFATHVLEDAGPTNLPKHPAPLILGGVCRRWRAVAVSMPSLWARIRITLTPSTVASQQKLLECWLERSCHFPLSVDITYPLTLHDPGFSQDSTIFYPIVDMINTNSHRWIKLALSLPTPLISRFQVQYEGGSKLQNLEVYCLPSGGIEDDASFGAASLPIHSPKTLKTYKVPFQSINVKHNNVTTFAIDRMSLADCYQLLESAISLVNCYIYDLVDDMEGVPSAVKHFVLLELQHLEIEGFAMSLAVTLLLDSLSLPSLNNLKITGGTLPSLLSLFIRSSCSIISLDMFNIEADGAQLIDLCRTMPSLQTLAVDDCGPMDQFLNHLGTTSWIRDGDDYEEFLPSLVSLTVAGHRHELSWASIPRIFPAESRPNRGRRPLQKLKVGFWVEDDSAYIDEETIPLLCEVLNSGIKLHVFDVEDIRGADFIQRSREFHNGGPREDKI